MTILTSTASKNARYCGSGSRGWETKLPTANSRNASSFAGNQLLAGQVDELLHNPYSQCPHSAMATFKQYLKDCYSLHSQPSSQEHERPQLGNTKFVQPRLTLKPMNSQSRGQERGSFSQLTSFHFVRNTTSLSKFFLRVWQAQRKTTISCHACQQWAKGNVFQEFKFVIHLSLD